MDGSRHRKNFKIGSNDQDATKMAATFLKLQAAAAALVVAEGTSIGVHLGVGRSYQINQDFEMDVWLLQETSPLLLADTIQWPKIEFTSYDSGY